MVGPRPRCAVRARPPLALHAQENTLLLDTLNSERFADTAPAAVHATLLDEGRYLGSVRTMYRLLNTHGGSCERRRQLTHPAYVKPELLAIAPNQVWSWDITKLKGPAKWTCFHLYVILDIFSRHVVGWLLAERESADLAEQLIADTVSRHDVQRGMLTLHADRGASMRSKPVVALLVELDIAKSHSRPHVSDDNPYSESQFVCADAKVSPVAQFSVGVNSTTAQRSKPELRRLSAGTAKSQNGHRLGTTHPETTKPAMSGLRKCLSALLLIWLREKDLNLRPLGYEPNELPDCSIARQE